MSRDREPVTTALYEFGRAHRIVGGDLRCIADSEPWPCIAARTVADLRKATEWITTVQMHYGLGPEASPADIFMVAAEQLDELVHEATGIDVWTPEVLRLREAAEEFRKSHHYSHGVPTATCGICADLLAALREVAAGTEGRTLRKALLDIFDATADQPDIRRIAGDALRAAAAPTPRIPEDDR